MKWAIETRGIGRRFGAHEAVKDLDLRVPEQSVFGFLGQNGAGKTTTIRMLLGLLKPCRGTASIFGHDVQRERKAAARLVGSLVETPSHYDHLTGRENLAITACLLGAPRSEIDRLLELVDLRSAADRRVGGYSLGMRQRLGVARALVGRPKLLILDEPSNGLDPNGIKDMRALISSLREGEGVTLFISSHLLSEIEHIATHVGLMDGGRLLMQAPMRELKGDQVKSVRLQVDRPEAVLQLLQESGLEGSSPLPDEVLIHGASADRLLGDIPALNFMMVENGIRVFAIEVREPSLENIFHGIVEAQGALASHPLPLAA